MDRNRLTLITTLSMGVALLLGVFFFALLVVRRAGGADAATPVIPIIVLMVIALLAVLMGVVTYVQQQNRRAKAKRDRDMFSVIDDLVQDLAPDEVDYLRGHLHAADDGPAVEESMAALLDQRAHDRRAGRRE